MTTITPSSEPTTSAPCPLWCIVETPADVPAPTMAALAEATGWPPAMVFAFSLNPIDEASLFRTRASAVLLPVPAGGVDAAVRDPRNLASMQAGLTAIFLFERTEDAVRFAWLLLDQAEHAAGITPTSH